MIKYIFKRIVYIFLVFFVMSLVLFFLFNLVPGDPARAELEPLRDILEPEEYQYRYEQTRKMMGLDDPLIVRYVKWITNMVQGDFGMSTVFKRPVKDVIVTPLKNTLFINVFSVTLALGITIPLGIITAVKKNSIFDKFVQVTSIIGYSLPVFITALLFIYLFAVTLGKFPVSGMATPNFQGTEWEAFKDKVWHLVLPLGVMTVGALAGLTRYVRAAMIDALSMDYIKTARAKGLKERVVILSHAWRNALLPVVTLIIGWIMRIFSGSLVVESMFNLPGMGKFYIDSLQNHDYNVAIAIQMLYIVIALAGNLLTDISYGIVDPRVRVNR